MAQKPGGKWQQMQLALMNLFRRDPALRADAARRVLHTLPSLAESQHGPSASAKKALPDPFAGLLDNGVGADLTTAVMPAAAQSFRYVLSPACGGLTRICWSALPMSW